MAQMAQEPSQSLKGKLPGREQPMGRLLWGENETMGDRMVGKRELQGEAMGGGRMESREGALRPLACT